MALSARRTPGGFVERRLDPGAVEARKPVANGLEEKRILAEFSKEGLYR
jgi:hypothetical protein